MDNTTNKTGFKFSYFQIESVKNFSNAGQQKSSTINYSFTIDTADKSESVNKEIQNSLATENPDRLTLYQNFTDSTDDYVKIKFYLPKSGKTSLIIQNSDKTESMYLLNKKLKAGFHTLATEIRKEELCRFEYNLELKAGRMSQERKMVNTFCSQS